MTAAKAALRVEVAHRRAALRTAHAGEALAAHVLAGCAPARGAVVAGYWPIQSEIDVRPLMLALAARGHALVLPEVTPRGQVLLFRDWRPGEELVPGLWNTLQPKGEVRTPDFLLVPLLAFDRARNRLGYGGGYYDRTLAQLPGVFALGCAYAGQEVDSVPVAPHDRVLDAVATEAGIL